jgi:hypothetical protein
LCMRTLTMLVLLGNLSGFGQQLPLTIEDPAQLVGKQVNVQRLPLCQPGTYSADLSHAGKQATVISVKPRKLPAMSQRSLDRMTPEVRELMADQQKAATVLFQFEDGAKLDTCAPVGPKRLAESLELVQGQTLEPVALTTNSSAATPPVSTAPQECPVVVTKVTSSDGGFSHALADNLTSSEFERQLDKTAHGGKEKHYLDMRMQNNSSKPVRAIESTVVYANAMGDTSVKDSLISQNKSAINPGGEYKSFFMDRSLQSANGRGDVTVYISRIRFEDNTFWQDNGSHSCSLTSRIK